MNKNNLMKVLVPIVAIVIVIESLVLINNVNKNKTPKNGSQPVVTETITPNGKQNVKAVVDILVSGPSAMKLNTASVVEVRATAMQLKSVDSVNVYLKYNPGAFELTNLTFDKKLPTPTFSKVSTSKGMVVVNFLISDPSGLKINAGESIQLMKFDAKPKTLGKFDFEISTGNELKESATMFVENATSAILPFSSNKLTVDVGR